MTAAAPPIRVDGLIKTYRGGLIRRRRVDALRGVTFEVQAGEIFGILGRNGAGKTTLIKILLGIVRRSGGVASLFGRRTGDRPVRARVGYLPENHRIPRHHTGDTALEYYGMLSGLSGGEIRRRRPAMLEVVGLSQWGKTPVKEYSKGMQQRLGLAQALMHDPELLILDEPTDGVDPEGRSDIREVLRRLKQQGKTIFLNSHLLHEIELICDQVVILDRGRVLRQAPVSQLRERPDTEVTFELLAEAKSVERIFDPRLKARFRSTRPGVLEAAIDSSQQSTLDKLVDDLRAAGISIAAIRRERQSLEEAFLEIIKDGAAAEYAGQAFPRFEENR